MQNPETNNNELITHIVTQLKNTEEAYNFGAWEKFNEQKKYKSIFWLRSTAAILVLSFALFFWLGKNTIFNQVAVKKYVNNTIVETKNENALKIGKPKPVHNNSLKAIGGYKPAFTLSNDKLKNSSIQFTSKLNKQKSNDWVLENQNSVLENVADIIDFTDTNFVSSSAVAETNERMQTQLAINKLSDSVNPTKVIESKPTNTKTADFFIAQAEILEPIIKDIKGNKWSLGLAISPSFGNTPKLNMGYGLNMEYALSPKISINSGLIYNQLSATKNIEGANIFQSEGSVRSPNDNAKNLESVNANISGLDIPLEIKYHINKFIYANFGVSAFATLNQQRSDSFIEEKLVTQLSVSITGEQQENVLLVYERSTQKVADSQVDIPKYLAFYNFSFGFRQKVARNSFINFEPFLKLPVQEITAERLRLIGTGLRLKFNFK